MRAHFDPLRTVLPLYLTVTPYLLNDTSHPASQSTTTDIVSGFDASPGTMCPFQVAIGKSSRSNVHWCVDFILLPLGSVTLMELVAGVTDKICASVIGKLLVAPESKIAHCLTFSMFTLTVFSNWFAA